MEQPRCTPFDRGRSGLRRRPPLFRDTRRRLSRLAVDPRRRARGGQESRALLLSVEPDPDPTPSTVSTPNPDSGRRLGSGFPARRVLFEDDVDIIAEERPGRGYGIAPGRTVAAGRGRADNVFVNLGKDNGGFRRDSDSDDHDVGPSRGRGDERREDEEEGLDSDWEERTRRRKNNGRKKGYDATGRRPAGRPRYCRRCYRYRLDDDDDDDSGDGGSDSDSDIGSDDDDNDDGNGDARAGEREGRGKRKGIGSALRKVLSRARARLRSLSTSR